ncbi:hypothetical protein MTR_2g040590 [Medicago truncatula]|uniref:Uncharacterized protein n=1 Tax=Medicago truncatula TaxID=3880 RepID=A0A072VH80_MEDTR|nr:hypothetical protein MTR_2g040590 [Medicago truncatula]
MDFADDTTTASTNFSAPALCPATVSEYMGRPVTQIVVPFSDICMCRVRGDGLSMRTWGNIYFSNDLI